MAYVYVLRSGAENIFKIGRTKGDVDARILQLSTGNPYPLTKFDLIETEHDAHCESYCTGGSVRSALTAGQRRSFLQ
jgi:T5orf172 domain